MFTLVTSAYAAVEARRNLVEAEQLERLDRLLVGMEILEQIPSAAVEEEAVLPEKDRTILRAAVCARATHLVTGDVRHFGAFFGAPLHGVLVVTPARYLRERR